MTVAEALSNQENVDVNKHLYLTSSMILQTMHIRNIWDQEGKPDLKKGRPNKTGVNLHRTFITRAANITGSDVKDFESSGKNVILTKVGIFSKTFAFPPFLHT